MSCNTILPKNIDEAINALDLVGCERIGGVQEQIAKIEHFNDALEIDEAFLALMVDEYEAMFLSALQEFEKRKLVHFAQNFYPKLGTVYAVKEVLKVFEIETELKEWFDYEGDPYHFKVVLTPQTTAYSFDEAMFLRITSLIDRVKNVRSRLDGFEIALRVRGEVHLYGGYGARARIERDAHADVQPHIRANVAGAQTFQAHIAKNAQYAKSFQSSTHLDQGKIVRTSIAKEAEIAMNISTPNKVQGAVLWRV